MERNPGQGQPPNYPERSGTVLESDEEIRQAVLSGLKGQAQQAVPVPAPPPAAVAPPQPPPQAAGRAASPYRPTARPAMALLTVCDDGKLDGETIRIRDYRFVIGRTEGNLTIPFDGRMSARHVEITHQVVGGLSRWVITDLQSTHGMFVRVSRTALSDKAEFLVGNGRYRLDIPQQDAGATVDYVANQPDRGETQGWSDGPGPFRPPALTELLGKEIGNRTLLIKPEYWIGTDPGCPICRADDPFCEPRHARVFRGPRGHWHAEHSRTQNGLWLRMTQVNVEAIAQFQIGEQRFRLKVQ